MSPHSPRAIRPQGTTTAQQLEQSVHAPIPGGYLPTPPAAAPPIIPPAPPASRHITYASPVPGSGNYGNDDERAGKAPPPQRFMGEAVTLEGWIAQMQAYFTITCTRFEEQRIAQVGLCVGGEVLTWWEKAQFQYPTWQAMADAMRTHYGDHYAKDNTYEEIIKLRMTGTVQSYLTHIQQFNHLAGIDDQQLIRIVLNGTTSQLCQSMAH